ncbi:unnamed protein product [Moneuplotes crassus]|uniref:Uncharacterized protein n=2 Tax=Euplotes crassus TaxID=5936 RepID=A0AAD1XNB9_EUPCR|nr:unnamed protein product [Moneuplotes crassus]
MDKIIRKVKSVRYNVWEDFKKFMSLPGYKYYKSPPELKFRYPAPGSVPRTQEDKPGLFKDDYKLAYTDSLYDVRRKPKFPHRFGDDHEWYHVGPAKKELDPKDPYDAQILKGPIRNRRLVDDKATHIDSNKVLRTNKDEARAHLRHLFASAAAERHERHEELLGHSLNELEDYYSPQYLWFYERGATGTGDDPVIQHTYLSLEDLLEEVLGKERIETQQMDMYKGTVKKWQVLDDEQFTKDQVDKVQSSIKAPISDELNRYEKQNNIKHPLPINNANASQWRDKKRAIDSADFNSKLIEFEQNRHENYFMKRYERPKKLE